VRPSGQWINAVFCALALTASPGCNQHVDTLQQGVESNPPMNSEAVYLRQLDLDAAAMFNGMAHAHGAQVEALTPGP
jgi:hypothetical protein